MEVNSHILEVDNSVIHRLKQVKKDAGSGTPAK